MLKCLLIWAYALECRLKNEFLFLDVHKRVNVVECCSAVTPMVLLQVLINDFFLVACLDDFIENARLLIFETFCRIHECISIR